jgi:hypothetical protein
MFKIVIIFLTIILYKILVNTFSQDTIMQGRTNLIMKCKTNFVIITYNIIYFYSVCQIKCNQLYDKILLNLDMFKKKTENELIDNIELFDLSTNKNKIFTENEQQIFNQMVLSIRDPNNLLIISKSAHQKNINKKIINKKIDANICNYDFDISKIAFIALYLNYNDVRYNINLKTEEFNYYLVGNIIDKQFVQYYINNILKLKFCYKEEDLLSYQLELMDHEVNIIILNACQYILIEKDSYQILDEAEISNLVKEKVE